MHTKPFCLLNLAETCTDYNRGGTGVLYFSTQPYRYERYWEDVRGQFGVFRTATRRHMISIISLRAAAGSDALRPVDLQQEYLAWARRPTPSEPCAALANRRKAVDHAGRIATFGSCRNEMIFEPAGPSCCSGGLFAAFMEQGSAKGACDRRRASQACFGGNLSNGMSAGV